MIEGFVAKYWPEKAWNDIDQANVYKTKGKKIDWQFERDGWPLKKVVVVEREKWDLIKQIVQGIIDHKFYFLTYQGMAEADLGIRESLKKILEIMEGK